MSPNFNVKVSKLNQSSYTSHLPSTFIIQQTPEFTIREDQIPNINFGAILATDADLAGPNSEIYFYVTSEKLMVKSFEAQVHLIIVTTSYYDNFFPGGNGADAIGVISASGLVFLMRSVVSKL